MLTHPLAATDGPLVHVAYGRCRMTMLKVGVERHGPNPARAKRRLSLTEDGETL